MSTAKPLQSNCIWSTPPGPGHKFPHTTDNPNTPLSANGLEIKASGKNSHSHPRCGLEPKLAENNRFHTPNAGTNTGYSNFGGRRAPVRCIVHPSLWPSTLNSWKGIKSRPAPGPENYSTRQSPSGPPLSTQKLVDAANTGVQAIRAGTNTQAEYFGNRQAPPYRAKPHPTRRGNQISRVRGMSDCWN